MANNKTINGVTVATDEIAGIDYQLMKLAAGTEDSIVRIDGDVDGVFTHVRRVKGEATASLSQVSISVTSVTLKAANTARRRLLVVNNSTVRCYIAYAATASLAIFTLYLDPGAYWEMPDPVYTGLVSVIFAATGSGQVMVTEL